MMNFFPEQAYKAGYIMPNQYKPDLVGAPNSMSPHLRFGCLSIRKFYWDIHDLFAKVSRFRVVRVDNVEIELKFGIDALISGP